MNYFMNLLIRDFDDTTDSMFKNFFFFAVVFFVISVMFNRIIKLSSINVVFISNKATVKTIFYKIFILVLLGVSTFSISLFMMELIGYGFLSSEILIYQIAGALFLFLTQVTLIINYMKF